MPTSATPSFPPEFIYQENLLRCGYAPRALHWASSGEDAQTTLFIGCKDGSIWRLRWPQPTAEPEFAPLPYPNGTGSGVRCILEVAPSLLLIGRSNGQLEVINIEDPKTRVVIANEEDLLKEIPGDQKTRYGG